MSRVDAAVAFLTHPSVKAASLPEKCAFLQQKGLSKLEIDEALQQARVQLPSPPQAQAPWGPTATSWRDFAAAAAVLGVAAWYSARWLGDYLAPYWPFTQTDDPQHMPSALEKESQRDVEMLEEATATLKLLQEESEARLAAVESEQARVAEACGELKTAVADVCARVRSGGVAADEAGALVMQQVGQEAAAITQLVPRLVAKTARVRDDALDEVQAELKSLRALMQPSGIGASVAHSGAAAPKVADEAPAAGPVDIPAWQRED